MRFAPCVDAAGSLKNSKSLAPIPPQRSPEDAAEAFAALRTRIKSDADPVRVSALRALAVRRPYARACFSAGAAAPHVWGLLSDAAAAHDLSHSSGLYALCFALAAAAAAAPQEGDAAVSSAAAAIRALIGRLGGGFFNFSGGGLYLPPPALGGGSPGPAARVAAALAAALPAIREAPTLREHLDVLLCGGAGGGAPLARRLRGGGGSEADRRAAADALAALYAARDAAAQLGSGGSDDWRGACGAAVEAWVLDGQRAAATVGRATALLSAWLAVSRADGSADTLIADLVRGGAPRGLISARECAPEEGFLPGAVLRALAKGAPDELSRALGDASVASLLDRRSARLLLPSQLRAAAAALAACARPMEAANGGGEEEDAEAGSSPAPADTRLRLVAAEALATRFPGSSLASLAQQLSLSELLHPQPTINTTATTTTTTAAAAAAEEQGSLPSPEKAYRTLLVETLVRAAAELDVREGSAEALLEHLDGQWRVTVIVTLLLPSSGALLPAVSSSFLPHLHC